MKKQYIQPLIEAYAIKGNTILAGSLNVKHGTTSEQGAKQNNPDFDFGKDDEDDF